MTKPNSLTFSKRPAHLFLKSASTLLFVLSSAALSLASPIEYIVDTEKSVINWTGEKVTGGHTGVLKIEDGTALIENGKLVGGTFQVKMTSLKVTDITDPKNNKKLTDHLYSDDFFNIHLFPLSTFRITKAQPILNAKENEPNYTIEGELSIKGVSAPISFPATVQINELHATAKGLAKVDRTKFNIRYGSGKFFENLGDKLIYDEFKVELDLSSNRI